MPTYRRSFISHAHADNALCDPYAAALTRLGAPHYYDRETPQHGALLPFLLQEEVRKARTLVVMITPAAQASPWVKLEVAMFHSLMASEPDRTLVWVRLVNCAVEPLYAAHLGIDAVGRPHDQVAAELARALEVHSAPWPAAPGQSTPGPFGTNPSGSYPSANGRTPAAGYSRVVDWRHGMGDHTTITAAIEAARPGERILVRQGVYEGALNITQPLEIAGDGQPGDVEVRASGQNAIEFTAAQGRVANLTVRQTGGGGGNWSGVNIKAGRLDLEDCDISSQGGAACVGIHDGADPRIRRCRIHDGSTAGIYVYDRGMGLIEDCDIFGNTNGGISVSGESAPTMRRCHIHNGKAGGVFFYDKGRGLVEDCDIIANGKTGVEVKTDGAPTVRNCRINRNTYDAFYVHEHGGGVFENNDIRGNGTGPWDISSDSMANVTRRGNIE